MELFSTLLSELKKSKWHVKGKLLLTRRKPILEENVIICGLRKPKPTPSQGYPRLR